MKKKILPNYSLFILLILLAFVSVQGQTLSKYEAHIPFDFTVGKNTYEAGNYRINFRRPNYLATLLEVATEEGEKLQVTAIIKNGNRMKGKKTSLIFDRYGNRYVLKKFVSKEFGFSLPKTKVKAFKKLSKNLRDRRETVSVTLTRRK